MVAYCGEGEGMRKTLTEKQVIKMYIDNIKEWSPQPTKEEMPNAITQQTTLAKMSYAENEGAGRR